MPRTKLTAGRVRDFSCPTDKAQVFLWDTEVPGFAVRATPGSSAASDSKGKGYIFQGKLNGKDLRITIGDVRAWILAAARDEARRLQTEIDQGHDPREQKRERIAAAEARREEARRIEEPALMAWQAYIEARSPQWGERSIKDHLNLSSEGGKAITRGRKTTEDGRTQPGALRALLALPLSKIDADAVRSFLADDAAKRPTQAGLAFRLLRAFLNWCADRPEYRGQVQPDACAGRIARETLPKRQAKQDALTREMLKPWFEQVQAIANPVQAAYLQVALLTGARREEVAGMRWEDVDFRWRKIIIKDKVEGERTIPLTPHVAGLLLALKARSDTPPPEWRILHGKRMRNDLEAWTPSPWVFASPTAASGRIQEPRIAHNRALQDAGLPPLTIHGLRRSFGSLSEWCEVPAGIVAQIQGHKPSATAEKHYRVRPIDLLRVWHERIEAWILTEAGIEQPKAEAAAPGLRVVA